ncbi:MAG: CocE/NonD family hydrolase [Micavibrio sp.]|nr:MAG: CocE/NonD family hydrolase [Micavibrio sp.]
MRHIDEFPYKVKEIRHMMIPMPDGTELAARLWLPETAENNPVPLILEYLPYRKNDSTTFRDSGSAPYIAGHGYAYLRVDIRGSGDSDGVMTDEYTEQELKDGEEILKWAAAQSWCDDNCGMIGISWGGFNALQIAGRTAPELKAIIAICFTDDRYADDIHYMGGCFLNDQLSWASIMFSGNARPPDPENVGEKWRDLWKQRLEGSGLWLENWLNHQRRDDFWKHGSVCEDYSTVKCPVFAVSGWADGYSNAVFRVLEHLDVPRLGLVGPWAHKYPHGATPGPAIGFLQEELRWWDQWLKGKETGIMDEPMLRAWVNDSVRPAPSYAEMPGNWVGEESWPSANISDQGYGLCANGRLVLEGTGQETENAPLSICSPLSHGLFAGKWYANQGGVPDLPSDQRLEDGGALVFETAPLATDFTMLGAPAVTLALSADKPVAITAVRLSDVAPDGAATRVTYGLLNLTHRDSHETPEYLEPGKIYTVRVQMNEAGHRFPEGHRIRLSVASSYWPLAWPAPEPVTLTLEAGQCRLALPRRQQDLDYDTKIRFDDPVSATPRADTVLREGRHNWKVEFDFGENTVTQKVISDDGRIRLDDIDLETEDVALEEYSYQGEDYSSLRGEVASMSEFRRGDWHVRTDTQTVLRADTENFYIKAALQAYEGEEEFFRREWDLKIPRDFM